MARSACAFFLLALAFVRGPGGRAIRRRRCESSSASPPGGNDRRDRPPHCAGAHRIPGPGRGGRKTARGASGTIGSGIAAKATPDGHHAC